MAGDDFGDQTSPRGAATMSEPTKSLTRRRFLQLSTAGLAGITVASGLSACGAPATPAPTAISSEAKPTEAAKPGPQAGPGGFTGGSSKPRLRRKAVPTFDGQLD